MTVNLSVEIDGEHVPLTECEWVLWARCGCPVGAAVGALANGGTVNATEEAAWGSFFDYKRDIDRARRRGERVELMTRERWASEVMPRMRTGCPHDRRGGSR